MKARQPVLFFKARGWWGPEHGGDHRKLAPHQDGAGGSSADRTKALPSSAKISSMEEAQDYWREHFGGKTMALAVRSGGKEFPIKVSFDATNDHAFTNSRDESGKKLANRVFSLKRAQAMSRILGVIESPSRRLINHGSDLLLEKQIHGEHYTVVLTWVGLSGKYHFNSAHFKTAQEVARLYRYRDRPKNNGPLQKSEPLGTGPSVFRTTQAVGVSPTGSQPRFPVAPARNCKTSIGRCVLLCKGSSA